MKLAPAPVRANVRSALAIPLLTVLLTGGAAGALVVFWPDGPPAQVHDPEADARGLAREAGRFVDDADEAMTAYLAGETSRASSNERLRWGGWTFFSLHRREDALTEPARDTPAREALSDAIGLGLYGTSQARSCVNGDNHASCRDARHGLDRARSRLEDFQASLAAE